MFDTNVDTPHASLIPQTDPEEADDDPWELGASHFDCIQHSLAAFNSEIVVYKPKSRLPYKPDYQLLRPLFGWIPLARIRDTIRCTTQWYQADTRLPMRRHFKSRFPGANVPRRNESIATDTIFSDTPANNDGIAGHGGCTMLQFYCGCTSEFSAGYPMSTETQMSKTLSDFI